MLHLIDGSRLMKTALENNLLWSHDEKYWWFDKDGNVLDQISTERKSMVNCASHLMPKWLSANERTVQSLKSMNIRKLPLSEFFYDWDESTTTTPPPGWGQPQRPKA